MDDLLTNDMMKNLETLLKPPDRQEDSSEDDEYESNPIKSKLGPGDIGERLSVKIKGNQGASDTPNSTARIPVDPNDIWDPNEIPAIPFTGDDLSDPRERPEFDMKYKQALRSEDIFLQMGNRTGASASCEIMIVTIELPGEDKSMIDLTVQESSLDIRSPRYRLHLDLPHPVREDQTKALWNGDTYQLTVELTLNREWDSINF